MRCPAPRSPSSMVQHKPEPLEAKNFSQLPMDILYTLFLSIKTAEPEKSLFTIVVASHVCRCWRAVAIGAPLLWTYVRVSWTSGSRNHISVVTSLLKRSQHLPIILHFDIGSVRKIESSPLSWQKVFSPHSHRVRELVMSLYNFANYRLVVYMLISPLKFSAMTCFHLDMKGPNRTQISASVKPREQVLVPQCRPRPVVRPVIQPTVQPIVQPVIQSAVQPIVQTDTRRYIMFHYLDWLVWPFQITSLSLKCAVITVRELLPILIVCQSTLIHVEYYVSNCLMDWVSQQAPKRFTLPVLTSLRIGYSCTDPAFWLVARLDLPRLSSVMLHDFRRCPEAGLPPLIPEKAEPKWTDAYDVLMILMQSITITKLTLRGVECFSSSFEEVTEPLHALFQGLKSLSLIKCDSQFFHILHNTTLESSFQALERLSDLAITCYDYSMVLEYLRLRKARGLPRLNTLSVNSKMAILRHFTNDFVSNFHVRGTVKRKPRQDITFSHPYLRQPRYRRVNLKTRGLNPQQGPFHST
ncbi:hypothetical protein H2248_002027 [Termitomyces sp. 'cryptogamus']|nr:hypothetical protein H2248_002027 [Termitomyces sp. 'cryptogamus']